MEHNEPNLPDLNELCGYIQETYGKDIADRIHKCVLACMGMSDEEVEKIPVIRKQICTDSCIADEVKALKSQLDEAVGLLEKIPNGWDNPDFWITEREVNDVRAFLAKHKDTP